MILVIGCEQKGKPGGIKGASEKNTDEKMYGLC